MSTQKWWTTFGYCDITLALSFFRAIAELTFGMASHFITMPKEYLNWILLDERFNYVASSSGQDQVKAANAASVYYHQFNNLQINKNGYLYVYVSNQTPNQDVFFDNLQVTLVHGPVLEENHYYPFGLTMQGISSKALNFGNPENKYKYNGIELDTALGLDEYEAHFRDLDPQTGRWWQIDPKTDGYENLSPYASMYDDPERYGDPMGDEGDACCLLEYVKAILYTSQAVNEQTFKTMGSDTKTLVGYGTLTLGGAADQLIPGATQFAQSPSFIDGSTMTSQQSTVLNIGTATGDYLGMALGTTGGEPPGSASKNGGFAASFANGEAVKLNAETFKLDAAFANVFSKSTSNSKESGGSTKGAEKGSLSATKKALADAKSKIGLQPTETLPKNGKGKFGSPQRGDSKKGYRLDPAHPNAKPGSGEDHPHINYWDYSKGKKGKGGINGAIPINN